MNKLKKILFSPGKFFSEIKKEKGVRKAFNFLAGYYLFFMILSGIVFFVTGEKNNYSGLGINISNKEWIIVLIGTYIFGLLFSFVSALFLKLWIRIFGGKGKYEDAYKLNIYSNAPYYLIGWMPLINMIIWVYGLGLLIIGTKKIYKFSTTKAILIYVVPLAILFLLFLVILMIYFSSIAGNYAEPIL